MKDRFESCCRRNFASRKSLATLPLMAPGNDATHASIDVAQLLRYVKERQPVASYGPLVATCQRYGIGRTTAFALAGAGAIETFLIGRRRFVDVESLERLPMTLRKEVP